MGKNVCKMQSDSSESMPAFNTILLGYVGELLHPSGTERTLKSEKDEQDSSNTCMHPVEEAWADQGAWN